MGDQEARYVSTNTKGQAETIEQAEWIAGHLRDMCLAAPPGLLHITIFITAKRTPSDAPVLDGFVTDDRRPPVQGDESAPASTRRVEHNAVVELRSGRPNFSELMDRELDLTEYGE
jgi:hypothetical protein